MVKLQIDLNEEQNKKVEIYKAIRGLETKEETVKEIIDSLNFHTNQDQKELKKKEKYTIGFSFG